MSNILRGAVGGLVATVPMSAVMILARTFFPAHAAKPLPPQQITEKVIDEATPDTEMERPHPKTAVVSHFAFGSVMGGVYGGLAAKLPGPPLLKGMVYGGCIWAGSYAGLLPLLHLQPRPQYQPRGRNITMILAHFVWGASLSALERKLQGTIE